MSPKAATCSAAASVKPPANVGQPPEYRPLLPGEQVVGPVEGGAQRLVPGRGGARAAGEHAEHVVEPLRRAARPTARASGRRPARSPAAARRACAQTWATACRLASVMVKDGATSRARSWNSLAACARPSGGTGQERSPSTPSGSRLVARMRSEGQSASRLLGEARDGGGEVLAVVEHQQDRPAAGVAAGGQVRGDGGGLVRFLGLGDAEPGGHRRRDELRVGQGCELDPGDVGWLPAAPASVAGSVRGGQAGREGQRQPRLAGAARAGQREQAALGEGAGAPRRAPSPGPPAASAARGAVLWSAPPCVSPPLRVCRRPVRQVPCPFMKLTNCRAARNRTRPC